MPGAGGRGLFFDQKAAGTLLDTSDLSGWEAGDRGGQDRCAGHVVAAQAAVGFGMAIAIRRA